MLSKFPFCLMSKSRILTDEPSNWVETVWRKNAPKIYKLCRARSRDLESAKDLFQEVALRFCYNAPHMDHDKPILPWFLLVLRNAAIDQRRQSVRSIPISRINTYRSREKGYSYDLCEHVAGYSSGIFQEKALHHELNYLMSDLNRFEKLAIEYCFIGGVGLAEAGKMFGLTRSTFYKKRCTALKKMVQKKNERAILLQNKDAPPFVLQDLLTQATEIS